MELEKAVLANLVTLERVDVVWNPERYAVSRRSRLAAPQVLGAPVAAPQAVAGGEERFTTDLLLDATRGPAERRDLGAEVERLERWMDPRPGQTLPDPVLFAWGNFRFQGVLCALDQLWVLFAPDGTPRRGWVRIGLAGVRGASVDIAALDAAPGALEGRS